VFLDIVKFTTGRSVEAQCEVVNKLNELLVTGLSHVQLQEPQRTLIPTGDGVAIALFNVSYDTHLILALELLKLTQIHNDATADKMQQFSIRVGLNENVDNVIQDVNKHRNVAGTGISMAQRIMDKADGGQILVGETVFQALSPRERYMSKFRRFDTFGKHGVSFAVYQFQSDGCLGLNVDTPMVFLTPATEKPKLSKFAAYYIAIAAANREFLLSCDPDGNRDEVATILIAFTAEDRIEKSHTAAHESAHTITWKAGEASFPDQFKHYDDTDFWMVMRLANCIQHNQLNKFIECFERGSMGPTYAFVSKVGLERLHNEWPKVEAQFGLHREKKENTAKGS